MGVHEAHLVDKAAGDARHHVLDVGADGADAGELFTGGPPEFHAEVLGVELADVHVDVFEGLGEGAAGAFDGDHPAGDVDFDWGGRGIKKGNEIIRTAVGNGKETRFYVPPSGMARLWEESLVFMVKGY